MGALVMNNIDALNNLINRFSSSLDYYKNPRNNYNEHSCRIEYIDPLLKLLGWDVANERGLAPQYREVIAENYSTHTDRPDYTMTLRGVAKFFVEAKKPAVDITRVTDPAFQTRKYGWNANHRIAVLTNFEYLAIYDTCYIPKEEDGCAVARYRIFHFTEYADRYDEIVSLISRDVVYTGEFDRYLDDNFPAMMLFRSLSTRLSSFAFAKIRTFHYTTNFKIQLLNQSNFKPSWKNCSVLQTTVTTQVCFRGIILFLICPAR